LDRRGDETAPARLSRAEQPRDPAAKARFAYAAGPMSSYQAGLLEFGCRTDLIISIASPASSGEVQRLIAEAIENRAR
jgi:hypothetical protein